MDAPRSRKLTVADFPDLAAQLDVEATGLTAEQILAHTNKKVHWACPVAPDHRWTARGSHRVQGSGCPACAGHQVSTTNALSNHPHLASQLDVAATGAGPDQVIAGTTKKLHWVCPAGPDHRWSATGADRLRGAGCPFCAGQRVSVTNALSTYPHLAAQLDEAATGASADQVLAGTHSQLHWVCPEGPDHRWTASGYNRVNGTGCPACAGRQLSVTNALSNYPHLAAQLDVDATGLTPDQVVAGTNRKLRWVCPEGPDHRWSATGADRVGGSGCPACAGAQLSVTNALSSYPHLAAQLDVDATGLTPDQVIAGTNRKLHWVCPASPGHRWVATGVNRRAGSGCPHCARLASAREIGLAGELTSVVPALGALEHVVWVRDRRLDVDMLYPRASLAVEYDGGYWHKDRQARDIDKSRLLRAGGYTVIRVRELPLAPTSAGDVLIAPRTSIFEVTCAVLGALARVRPDLISPVQAVRYAQRGTTALTAEQVAAAVADARARRAGSARCVPVPAPAASPRRDQLAALSGEA